MGVNYKAKIAGKKKILKYIFGRLSVAPKFVLFCTPWQFIIQQTTKATKCAKLLVDRAAWFNSIYLNSTCSWVNTRRCGNANKEAQGSKDRIE